MKERNAILKHKKNSVILKCKKCEYNDRIRCEKDFCVLPKCIKKEKAELNQPFGIIHPVKY